MNKQSKIKPDNFLNCWHHWILYKISSVHMVSQNCVQLSLKCSCLVQTTLNEARVNINLKEALNKMELFKETFLFFIFLIFSFIYLFICSTNYHLLLWSTRLLYAYLHCLKKIKQLICEKALIIGDKQFNRAWAK